MSGRAASVRGMTETTTVAADVSVDALLGLEPWQLSDAATLEALRCLELAARRLDSVRLALVREMEERGLAAQTGARDTAAWLRATLGCDPGAAKATVELARRLSAYPATRAALAAAKISAEHAKVIVATLDGLHRAVEPARRVEAEALLLDHAAKLDPRALRRAGAYLRALTTPEDPADQAAAELERTRAEERAVEAREFYLIVNPLDGTVALRGVLDGVAGSELIAAIEALAAPRPSTETGPDPRPASRRRADALVELVRRALAGDLPERAGARPTLTVTVPFETLRAGLGPALLDTGIVLSAATARRLACDAEILPAVLGTRSEPLDLGRSSYPVSAALRRALLLRDGGCTHPDCDLPGAWCDAHHLQHWAQGGRTELTNLTLACPRHHTIAHAEGWTIILDAEGLPLWIPPQWVDPERRPRQNPRFRRLPHLSGRPPDGPAP